MSTAQITQTSQNIPITTESLGVVKTALEQDRRNILPWVPKGVFYGTEGILIIGIDAEWVNEGENTNRILSNQFFAVALPYAEWTGLTKLQNRKRLSLVRFLSEIIEHGIKFGKIKRWPKMVWLVSHFTLADITTFLYFPDYKYKFDSVRRTFVSIGRPLTLYPYDKSRHRHKVQVVLRDTMLLAPGKKQSLEDLGELVGVEKVDLEPGEIERMDLLLERDRARFIRYALRDPEIVVKYAVWMMALAGKITGKFEIPPTLSSLGVSHLLKIWERDGIDNRAVLGTESVREEEWSDSYQRVIKKRRDVPTADRNLGESFATECYHGGRNEQFHFGAGQKGVWTDWDLAGAYTTAMAMIGMPNWRAIEQTRDLDAFQPHSLGFARVKFSFPPDTRFPCLPVRTASGLIFPLAGESFCCAPEIYLARKLGAALEIVNGFIVPTDFENRPFEPFIIDCTKRRKNFEKGSLEELFWKELGNGTYGKVAQGLRNKRAFNSRSGKYQDLPPSRISNPYFAAFTTSVVRATIGEILSRIPLHREVWSVTTDGFITNSTPDEVQTAATGPICERFAQTRLRICGDPGILDQKAIISQPLGWRTRGQATLVATPGQKIVLAKAGIKPPFREKGDQKPLQNDWIIDQFISRNPDSMLTLKVLRNLPEIYNDGGDLVTKDITRKLTMDFDWKRCPDISEMRPIREIPHLYFSTVPWGSVEEFQACRDSWIDFKGSDGRVLKTEDDLRSFNEFRVAGPARTGIKRSRKQGAIKIAERMFLRAYVRSAWGLDAQAMSYSELASWLSTLGYPTSKADVENAKRPSAKLLPGVAPRTPAVETFIAKIRERFPNFQADQLLVPDLRSSENP